MMKLAAMMEPVSMNNFEARLNDERGSKAIMEQRARLVMEKMPEVYNTPALRLGVSPQLPAAEPGHNSRIVVLGLIVTRLDRGLFSRLLI